MPHSSPPILLLHGALGCSGQVRGLAELLRGDRRVLAPDFSGHGREAGGRADGDGGPDDGASANGFGIARFASDVEACLDRERIDRADVFGYSMGGYVALRAASRRPERFGKIMTLATKFDWNPATAEREASRLDPDVLETKAPAFARRLREWHGADWRRVVRSTARMMIELGGAPALTATDLRGVRHSVLLTVGDRDAMVSVGETTAAAGSLPAGAWEVLAETPHPFDQVNLGMLSDRLRRFLAASS